MGKVRFQDRKMSLIRHGLGLLCLILTSIPSIGQTVSEDWLKAEYMILLSGYVGWPDEDRIDTFRMGVFGSEAIYTQLSFKSESENFKEKPFQVSYYKRRDEVRPVHVLYIGEEKNNYLKKLRSKWKQEPMLFITDSSNAIEYNMINLLGMNLGGKPFEVNKSNIENAGLTISSKILAVGGSEEDLRAIYRASTRELEALKSEISGLNDELLRKQVELETSIQQLDQRTSEINALNAEIDRQTQQLGVLSGDIDVKQKDLADKLALLQSQEDRISKREEEIQNLNLEISAKEQEIRARSETQAEQQKNIREQRLLMNEQQAILDRQKVQIHWQKNALIFFIILSLLVLMMGFFIYRAYRIKIRANRILREKNRIIQDQNTAISHQKEEISAQRDQLQRVNYEIEKKNENITASIYYALTIQQAILPGEDEIRKYFDSFIIYYPKDIVSGDFYWFSHIPKKKSGEEISFIAVVDCTGHGVPGGFLSMIGARMLSAIINENREYETDNILEIMDQRLKQALNQQKSTNDDGMDISLCRIIKSHTDQEINPDIYLSFSGAHQHLFLVRGNQDVETIRGTRRTVGGKHFNPEPFTKKDFILETGDMVYLCSDGLADQHSPSRERYGSRRLVQFLNEHKDLPMEVQKQKLEEEMIVFMKTEKQRDDITILGIKL